MVGLYWIYISTENCSCSCILPITACFVWNRNSDCCGP